MDLSASPPLGGRTARQVSEPAGTVVRHGGRAGPALVLLGGVLTVVGFSWDIHWHIVVGPDTFFTAPHLMVYAGCTLAGVTSLVMVLLATAGQRAGRPVDRAAGGPPVRVFGGVFTAPLGYLISGLGAASFLVYGLLDLWWHTLYGFDAVLDSPPHIALFVSISITVVGSVVQFAATDRLWGRVGVVVALAVLAFFSPIPAAAFQSLGLLVDPMMLTMLTMSVVALTLGAGVLRRPGSALLVAAAIGALQALTWWFSVWATRDYADALGLPFRDAFALAAPPPTLPSLTPMFLVIGALVVEVVRWRSGTAARPSRRASVLAGGGAGLLVGATLPLQFSLMGALPGPVDVSAMAILGLTGAVAGVLGGFLGRQFTVMLGALAPVAPEPVR
jgi:hypothetical protein